VRLLLHASSRNGTGRRGGRWPTTLPKTRYDHLATLPFVAFAHPQGANSICRRLSSNGDECPVWPVPSSRLPHLTPLPLDDWQTVIYADRGLAMDSRGKDS